MSKQAKLPVSLLQPFDYLDKPASGYTSSSDEGNTWPEQETILAWLDKFSIAADNEQVYELAQALTAERVRLAIGLAEKVDKLQAQVDSLKKLLKVAECPDGNCVNGTVGVWKGELPDGTEAWESYECQWCAERKAAIKGESDE